MTPGGTPVRETVTEVAPEGEELPLEVQGGEAAAPAVGGPTPTPAEEPAAEGLDQVGPAPDDAEDAAPKKKVQKKVQKKVRFWKRT